MTRTSSSARVALPSRRERRGHRVAAEGRTPPLALTGTPGVGKSSVGRALGRTLRVLEVGELALRGSVGRPIRGGVEVDLERLVRVVRAPAARASFDVLVGHLAHLLPVHDVVVLRCHPVELRRRLARARRGTRSDRRENATAEALDLVLIEALRLGRRVWEIDTTRRSVEEVARAVARRYRRRGPSEYGGIDWLRDPRVTAGLLRPKE